MLYRLEWVKCGKLRCRCASVVSAFNPGARAALHGPYWFAFWNEDHGRKLRKRYVGKTLPKLRTLDRVSRDARRLAGELHIKLPGDDSWRRRVLQSPFPDALQTTIRAVALGGRSIHRGAVTSKPVQRSPLTAVRAPKPT